VAQDVEIDQVDDDRALGGIGYPRTTRRLVPGKNIQEDSLLATDYLNHFNEIIMLLEIIPSMPDCFEDMRDWKPKTYQAHFIETNFQNKDLAVHAYYNAPARYRQPFDQVVGRMDALLVHALSELSAAVDAHDTETIEVICASVGPRLRRLGDVAGAIINGNAMTVEENEIETLLAEDL
jgi:hypothetical protein